MEKSQTPAPSAVPPQCVSVEVGGCIHMHMLQRHLHVFVCAQAHLDPIFFILYFLLPCISFVCIFTHIRVCARAVH